MTKRSRPPRARAPSFYLDDQHPQHPSQQQAPHQAAYGGLTMDDSSPGSSAGGHSGEGLRQALAVPPSDILGRLVADPLDPLRELAPPLNIIIDARIISTADPLPSPSTPSASSSNAQPTPKSTHRHAEPVSTWDALNTHPMARGALEFFLELHPKATYFAVGVRTRARRRGEQVVRIGAKADEELLDEKNGAELLESGVLPAEDVVSDIEYIKVSVGRKGELVFDEYGNSLDVKLSHARKWSHDHPRTSRALKAGAIGVSVAAAVPLAVGATLGAIGFGVGGVAAGSIAAAIQASLGAAGAGSLIAACEAIGIAGVAAGTAVGIGAGAAATSVTIDTVRARNRDRPDADDEQDARTVTIRNEATTAAHNHETDTIFRADDDAEELELDDVKDVGDRNPGAQKA